ncbi:uncharacterized protein CCOS01_08713 [Colletotrichum costaricense]|uniref:Secreted protein n=1 Tax=Colletotrichum costaricense TaxID=1209916 RepID=A0AAI9YWD1_9PEZI|nr:uncharacterized protein CCOS01_08713 [Colletotrichum costaricense]KAK1526295.1 hypothetical protein CCOS01_08713 [Colletotrichum costaricense]
MQSPLLLLLLSPIAGCVLCSSLRNRPSSGRPADYFFPDTLVVDTTLPTFLTATCNSPRPGWAAFEALMKRATMLKARSRREVRCRAVVRSLCRKPRGRARSCTEEP